MKNILFFLLAFGYGLSLPAQEPKDLYPVKLRGKWGFINRQGELVVHTLFTEAYYERYKTVNIVKDNSGYFLANNDGKAIFENRYNNYHWDSQTGLLTFQDKQQKWGCIDTTGKIIVPFEQNEPFAFRDHIAVIKSNGAQGYYETSGSFISLDGFAEIKNLGEGFLAVRKVKKDKNPWGIYDTNKKHLVISPTWYAIEDAKYGYARVTDTVFKSGALVELSTGAYTIKPAKDQWIITSSKTSTLVFFVPDNLYTLSKKNTRWVVDHQGKKIFSLSGKYSKFSILGFYNGFATIFKDQNYGLIDRKGQVVIEPVYNGFRQFSEGLVPVKDKKGFWGMADSTGRLVVPCRYADASPLVNGLAIVTEGGTLTDFYLGNTGCRMGYINRQGEVVWSPSH